MAPISVTLDVFQLDIDMLKGDALKNIFSIFFTFEVSHFEISWLKFSASANI